jgi:hypothetical protein
VLAGLLRRAGQGPDTQRTLARTRAAAALPGLRPALPAPEPDPRQGSSSGDDGAVAAFPDLRAGGPGTCNPARNGTCWRSSIKLRWSRTRHLGPRLVHWDHCCLRFGQGRGLRPRSSPRLTPGSGRGLVGNLKQVPVIAKHRQAHMYPFEGAAADGGLMIDLSQLSQVRVDPQAKTGPGRRGRAAGRPGRRHAGPWPGRARRRGRCPCRTRSAGTPAAGLRARDTTGDPVTRAAGRAGP